jgi:2-keto-4-pentenoate hydratase/2-oxohepta-3-ene-1,7-dioic acid hydratase in catechol pathway
MRVYILVTLVELGIVIGKEAKSIKKENYLDYIEAYFIGLDLTDRTFQAKLKNEKYPWFFAKVHGFVILGSR